MIPSIADDLCSVSPDLKTTCHDGSPFFQAIAHITPHHPAAPRTQRASYIHRYLKIYDTLEHIYRIEMEFVIVYWLGTKVRRFAASEKTSQNRRPTSRFSDAVIGIFTSIRVIFIFPDPFPTPTPIPPPFFSFPSRIIQIKSNKKNISNPPPLFRLRIYVFDSDLLTVPYGKEKKRKGVRGGGVLHP